METTLYKNQTEELLIEASAKEKRNQLNEAILLYETVISQNETMYNAYLKLGALHEKMMDTEKAKDVYIKGLETAKFYQHKPAVLDLSYTLLGLLD
jgi:tetratricopeptide (TPR) repeat protein